MSPRSTTTPSFAHRYCCLSRDPHAACSRLNEMLPCACVAEYSLTGIDTIPKLTVSEANARAAIACLFVKNRRNDRLMGSSCQNAGKRATSAGPMGAFSYQLSPKAVGLCPRFLGSAAGHETRNAGESHFLRRIASFSDVWG